MTTLPDLSGLTTERSDPRFGELDRLTTREAAALMNSEDAGVPAAVAEKLDEIAAAVDAIAERMGRGGRLLYAGAGTAGRLGVLDASECPPTFSTDPTQVVGIIAGGPTALTTAIEGAEDDRDLAVADVARLEVGPDDSLVGISASGRTPYAIAAVEEARRRGAFTVGLSCNGSSSLGDAAEVAIEVVTGPEIVTGSTRLKAGTAQKLVLNMLSTLTMVRLGKTYGSLMVDVRATNEKLRARAHGMVAAATGAADDEVSRALSASAGRAKVAILMLTAGIDVAEADTLLDAHGGRLRAALAAASTLPDTDPQTDHHADEGVTRP
ncbi:N-acetylmuramic acid 6-phosphate etherase [Nigerium massiliense]|uniref:N-acetylmuramic acid 6-phosphate etherase n=1 Tax=Nigerium massiliense TaxID=1522317 RepID=UPI000694280B|nr:N-acetylmuramic acid 6-phosphate etherase [Nigerium massiliense]